MKFEEFLQERHANIYTGTDDDMPDAFNNWLAQLDGEDYIKLGELYGRGEFLRGKGYVLDKLKS